MWFSESNVCTDDKCNFHGQELCALPESITMLKKKKREIYVLFKFFLYILFSFDNMQILDNL